MVRRFLILPIAALAMPPAVGAATEPVEPKSQSDSQQSPRKLTRETPADTRCAGCATPLTRLRPMIDTPAPALLLIPAAFKTPGDA